MKKNDEISKLMNLIDKKLKYDSDIKTSDFMEKVRQISFGNKYSLWIVKRYLDHGIQKYEDMRRVENALSYFHRYKHRLPEKNRNIMSIKSLVDLENLVEPFSELDKQKELEKLQKEEIYSETKIVYSGPEGKILIPLTEEASSFWGQGTKWCTTGTNGSMFEHYNKKGPLYIFILNEKDKNGREIKYQLHIPSVQFMNSEDKTESLYKFIVGSKFPLSVYEKIFPQSLFCRINDYFIFTHNAFMNYYPKDIYIFSEKFDAKYGYSFYGDKISVLEHYTRGFIHNDNHVFPRKHGSSDLSHSIRVDKEIAYQFSHDNDFNEIKKEVLERTKNIIFEKNGMKLYTTRNGFLINSMKKNIDFKNAFFIEENGHIDVFYKNKIFDDIQQKHKELIINYYNDCLEKGVASKKSFRVVFEQIEEIHSLRKNIIESNNQEKIRNLILIGGDFSKNIDVNLLNDENAFLNFSKHPEYYWKIIEKRNNLFSIFSKIFGKNNEFNLKCIEKHPEIVAVNPEYFTEGEIIFAIKNNPKIIKELKKYSKNMLCEALKKNFELYKELGLGKEDFLYKFKGVLTDVLLHKPKYISKHESFICSVLTKRDWEILSEDNIVFFDKYIKEYKSIDIEKWAINEKYCEIILKNLSLLVKNDKSYRITEGIDFIAKRYPELAEKNNLKKDSYLVRTY